MQIDTFSISGLVDDSLEKIMDGSDEQDSSSNKDDEEEISRKRVTMIIKMMDDPSGM